MSYVKRIFLAYLDELYEVSLSGSPKLEHPVYVLLIRESKRESYKLRGKKMELKRKKKG